MRSQLLVSVAVVFALSACGQTPIDPNPVIGAENCTNNIDDNGDGKIDCLDPKCIETSSCVFGEICDNARDDNNNALIDCADRQCDGQSCGFSCLCVGGAKQIFNGVDGGTPPRDSGVVVVDAGQPRVDAGTAVDSGTPVVDAGTQPPVDAGTGTCTNCNAGCSCTGGVRHETNCTDSADNDQDLATDCADSDCATQSCGTGCQCESSLKKEIACGDNIDNDGNNGADCADPDCAAQSCGSGCACTGGVKVETLCNDNLDNDGNNGADCADPDCAAQSCGSGCACTGGVKRETICTDNIDNDGNNGADCADPDCAAASCGNGCVCSGNAKRETLCSDGADNDGDGSADCGDSDCAGIGTEVCGDGLDNNCNGVADCADSACTSTPACNLNDGVACLNDNQCAGRKCLTEAATGSPRGFCSNLNSCTISGSVGCHGGFCRANGGFNQCRVGCTGAGTSGGDACRAGYACFDPDASSGTANSYCQPHCTADSECAGTGAGYGCNTFSKRCEQKNKGLKAYGAACASASECEGGYCLTGPGLQGGYCSGPCRNDLLNCGTGGYCDKLAAPTDNLAVCLLRCDDFSQCPRSDDHYGCFKFTAYQTYSACQCLPATYNVFVYMNVAYPIFCCSGAANPAMPTVCN